MKSLILLAFLPALALANDPIYQEFHPEHHSKNPLDPVTVPGNRIKFVNGRPECPFKESTPDLESKLRTTNYFLLPAINDCKNYWICTTTGTPPQLAACDVLEVFVPELNLCIYYKYVRR